MKIQRVYIEKKEDYRIGASKLLKEFRDYLNLQDLRQVRIVNVYDFFQIKDSEKEEIVDKLLKDETNKVLEDLQLSDKELAFRVKFLDTQYNQREDISKEIVEKFILSREVEIFHSEIIILEGIDEVDLEKVKKYYINPIEKKEIKLDAIYSRDIEKHLDDVEIIDGFKDFSLDELKNFKYKYGIGLDMEDIALCQNYFIEEDRNPTITELKLIDTYWSDHCRHTTFNTEIENIEIEEGRYKPVFEKAIENYLASREYAFEDDPKDRPICLMDLATINMREQLKSGSLDNKESSREINAASIEIDVDVNGRDEKWLLMFKNETHNHPTEMEPFGGAATCLGGAIRDPLSGRAFVYQAMRISGSADPRQEFDHTLEGKLPQRTITRRAMEGYSSYGNQIGVGTGYVREYYDDGFVAKRLECGALVAAAPKEWVYRGSPAEGDLIVLVGGKTGRDGLGGAVGSSQKHTEDSLESSGAEVQKGNPLIERKIMRLFRKEKVSKMIKVCNDFGAGGVGVAIGELADGIDIDLDRVALKYPGLDGTEIALAESQERMAVLIDSKDLDSFLKEAYKEDLEANLVARVTGDRILRMKWRGREIVRIKRDFLDTNGSKKYSQARIRNPKNLDLLDLKLNGETYKEKFTDLLSDLNVANQKGLVENFDNTVGGNNILMPYGGKYRLTPAEGMVSKIPVLEGETKTCSIMTCGYDPTIGKISPFHGGYYALVDSVARQVALGGDYRNIRLSLQEYFERIDQNKDKWGKPLAALLGAYEVQRAFDIAAIGGKDSMSGSFEDINVPETLISFAVASENVDKIVSNELKSHTSKLVLIEAKQDQYDLLDLEDLKEKYRHIKDLVDQKKILSAQSVKKGGVARAILEMSFGNKLGFEFEDLDMDIFKTSYGSIVIEVEDIDDLGDLDYKLIGKTRKESNIYIEDEVIDMDYLVESWLEPLVQVFPQARKKKVGKNILIDGSYKTSRKEKIGQPRVLIPVLAGSHGEYSLAKAFTRLGADVKTFVFKTRRIEDIDKSFKDFIDEINKCHILALPDGAVYGNEPENSAKLMSLILKDRGVKKSLDRHLAEDNLILGVGHGLKALIRAGYIEGKFAIEKNHKYLSEIVDVELVSKASVWVQDMDLGQVYSLPIGSDESLILVDEDSIEDRQIITKFKDIDYSDRDLNIESISSLDGKVFGCLTAIDRISEDLYKNIDIKGYHQIFSSAINYFK